MAKKRGLLLCNIDDIYKKGNNIRGKNGTIADLEYDLLGNDLFNTLNDYAVGKKENVNTELTQDEIKKRAATQSRNRNGSPAAKIHYSAVADKLKKEFASIAENSTTEESDGPILSYREQIFKKWKDEFSDPIKDFEQEAERLLDDELYRSLKSKVNAAPLIEYLDRRCKSLQLEKQLEFLTTITLMSITRHYWTTIIRHLIPDNDPLPPREISSEEQAYLNALEAFHLNNYEEALRLLANALNPDDENDPDQNGRVYFLRSQCHQHLKSVDKEHFQEHQDAMIEDLKHAAKLYNWDALILMAEEYYDYTTNKPSFLESSPLECARACLDLLEYTEDPLQSDFAKANNLRGRCFWMLSQLTNNRTFPSNRAPEQMLTPQDIRKLSQTHHAYSLKSAEDYLKEAANCGHGQATELNLQLFEDRFISIDDALVPSDDASRGVFFVNDKSGTIYHVIDKTKPQGWREDDFDTSTQNLALHLPSPQRYMLISDDNNRNLADLLNLLHSIRDFDLRKQLNIEVYIRGEEKSLTPVIDTALSHIRDYTCPVHILDDDKMSARVLSRHPLLYPIRDTAGGSATLHYIIIGSSPCCQWLLREAFWMMTFSNEKIRTKITLIAPDADQVKNKLLFLCPGMEIALQPAEDRSKKDHTSHFSTIDFYKGDWESYETLEHIREITAGESIYFSVDIGSDLENMKAAIRLREEIIRDGVKQNDWFNIHNTVVTFHCLDPEISILSRNSVVGIHDRGDVWHNNYSIIPFGSRNQEYHWDELTNSIFERLAFNVHLQYNYEYVTDIDTSTARYRNAYTEYWKKTYNRDSSMAVAMSLPYRLYHVNYPKLLQLAKRNHMSDARFTLKEFRKNHSGEASVTILEGARCIHPYASRKITSSDAYYTEQSMQQLANALPDSEKLLYAFYNTTEDSYGKKCTELIQDSPTEQLAKWEHDRWNRFMISRGWLPVTAEEALRYYASGNNRQQLYIAELHPCIQLYDQLRDLESTWNNRTGMHKNFRQLDISNIEMTKSILNLEWTKEHAKEKEDSSKMR